MNGATRLSNPSRAEGDGKPRAFEKEYFRKDGTRVPVLLGAASFGESRDEELPRARFD